MFDEIKRLCFDAGYSSALNEWFCELKKMDLSEDEAKSITIQILSRRSKAWESFINPVKEPEIVKSGRREFAVIEGGRNDENPI